MKAVFCAVALSLSLLVAGCGDGDDSSATGSGGEATSPSVESGAQAAQRSKPKVVVPKGAPPQELVEKDLIEGDGAVAKSGDKVTVQYVGYGYERRKEFDSTWKYGKPFTITLGVGEVIRGWDEGIEGMKVGGRRELVIPPDLGYGAPGSPPAIGPNETLIFVIDLLNAK